jgi:hypothetical protein
MEDVVNVGMLLARELCRSGYNVDFDTCDKGTALLVANEPAEMFDRIEQEAVKYCEGGYSLTFEREEEGEYLVIAVRRTAMSTVGEIANAKLYGMLDEINHRLREEVLKELPDVEVRLINVRSILGYFL